jgi:DNA-binding HxlR family transcriptional regulator
MRSYGQFCPVAQALEIVGERWTLLIVRELLCGNYRFGELLNGVPLIPRSLLSQRLKSLEEWGLVEKHGRSEGSGFEYRLTDAGRALGPTVVGLGNWGRDWARNKLTTEQLDPVLLMWDMRRNLDVERLPAERTVVMFWFRDLPAKRSRYWLCVEKPEVELCLTNPGFAVALTVETKLRTMVEVWMGERNVKEALAEKAIELDGPSPLSRAFPSWLLLSTFAPSRAASRPG